MIRGDMLLAETWDWAYLIPIASFFMIVAIVYVVMRFRNERRAAELAGGGDYRRLAEEAVRGQKMLQEELTRMNQTLKEIERLLREVG